MPNITIKNSEIYEANPESFELITRFDTVLELVRKRAKRIKSRYLNWLNEASYCLKPYYVFDFGEDWPHVSVELALDDDIYVDLSGEIDQHEKHLETLFDEVLPKGFRIPLSIQIHPKSLAPTVGIETHWRTNPQYTFSGKVESVDQDTVEKIWSSSSTLHVFISHKAEIKQRAHKLKEHLQKYGIASFVAHDDIEPADEWQDSIEKALFSSDVLIALLCNNFSESKWTDQEVGIAIGRQLPVFPVMLEQDVDPYGFIGKIQAFKLRDSIITEFVEKFLMDERTSSPTINSILSVLKSGATEVPLEALVSLLEKTPKSSWKSSQKEAFGKEYEQSGALSSLEIAQSLYRELGLQPTKPSVLGADLDDEIPF